MEPFFEVRYYCNYKMMVEFARKISIGPRPPILIGFWAFYAVLLAFVMQNGIIGNVGYSMLIISTCMLVFSFLPHWYAWNVLKHSKKQNDGAIPETVITFGDIIEMDEGMVHLTIEYRKIVRTIRLKHSYMLMMGSRNGVMIDLNCFTKGTFKEFKQFLREKCPNVTVVE